MLEVTQLQSVPLFADFSKGEIQSVVSEGDYLELEAGAMLFEENSEGRDIYLLIEGKISIQSLVPGTKKQETKEFYSMKPFDVIGEFSFVDEAPRSASAKAVRTSTLFRLPAEALDTLIREDYPLGYKLMRNIARTLCDRIRSTNLALRNQMVWL